MKKLKISQIESINGGQTPTPTPTLCDYGRVGAVAFAVVGGILANPFALLISAGLTIVNNAAGCPYLKP
jgi:hypothetical protein